MPNLLDQFLVGSPTAAAESMLDFGVWDLNMKQNPRPDLGVKKHTAELHVQAEQLALANVRASNALSQ